MKTCCLFTTKFLHPLYVNQQVWWHVTISPCAIISDYELNWTWHCVFIYSKNFFWMCGVEESFTARAPGNENTSLCRIRITQSQPESSPTTQSQTFRGKMGVKDILSCVMYHKGWQLTPLDVLTKSMLEFFCRLWENPCPTQLFTWRSAEECCCWCSEMELGHKGKVTFFFSYKHKTASIIPHWTPLIVYIVVPLAEAPPSQ